MQFVPAKRPGSGSGVHRALILFFAGILVLGVFAPTMSSAAGPALLRVKNKTVTEGNTGTTTAHVKILLNHRTNHRVTVGWATADGSATAGSDYVAASGRARIPRDHRVAYANVSVIGDTTTESNEYFKVRLSRPTGARIADRVAFVEILDDDALPVLSVASLGAVKEGGVAEFRVSLSKAVSGPVSFHYATADNTATTPSDYTAIPDTVKTIPAGDTSVVITVETNDPAPDVAEPTESFFFRISNPTGATLGDAQALGVIEDD